LKAHLGADLGESGWHRITQEQINQFADATLDHQWIHIDPYRAESGPFGGPIAHGLLTLSLLPTLLSECFTLDTPGMDINYGFNRVRFPAPVREGSRVRAHAALKAIDDIAGGVQLVVAFELVVEGIEKPAVVGETVLRRYWSLP
jgi:acyl dehydratase